ncbi:MAG: aminotransferase class V-fold PLP-dependent enzyme [Oscillospiraceae bacterium]|nr:aminotransferase class V-fold PLP-dependent enzyme [Oscillospiraceae bacterium]
MIYFDNAATTYPKPDSVLQAARAAPVEYGGNPGRSGHSMSLKTAEAVYAVREKAAKMFDADPENAVFTLNCTHALNLAIKGVAVRGGHYIISSLEHNSVARPVHALAQRGISYSIARVYEDDERTMKEIISLINPYTKGIICTMGSNVTGQILPFGKIGELCSARGLIFIADGAQVCGVLPISLKNDCINILCMPGHKGLYGISGTGMLITDGKYPIHHIMEGGTGSTSLELNQPDFLPDRFESGTVNTVGIISLGAGMDYLAAKGIDNVRSAEDTLCSRFINGVRSVDGVKIYRQPNAKYLPIVLFNIESKNSEETATELSDAGFALRGGYHCSGLAHRSLGTLDVGGVRFSPSAFNTAGEVDKLISAVKRIAAGM